MLWTRDAEEALHNAEDDREIMPFTKQRFLNLLSILIKQTTYDLSKFDRVKYETLITIHVHQSDIFNDLSGFHHYSPQKEPPFSLLTIEAFPSERHHRAGPALDRFIPEGAQLCSVNFITI